MSNSEPADRAGSCIRRSGAAQLSAGNIAAKYFGADAPWYLRNIQFLEIIDREIPEIYYYRWKVFRSHIREIGPERTTILEFSRLRALARQPFTDHKLRLIFGSPSFPANFRVIEVKAFGS